MIKMFNNRKEIALSDLINIDFLQKLQDDFAVTVGVASLTVDDKGPITKPSNFTDFCTNHIRASKLGFKKCNESDIEGGVLAVKKGEPIIYKCHAGLTHFAVPIMLNGKHIASILGGQISTKKPDEQQFRNLAKELGITKENEYMKDLRKIKVIPEENIKVSMKLLSVFANFISMIAYKNYELIKKNQREDLTSEIVKKIRSTLDAEEVKKYFVEITQKYFDADRCVFADYDSITDKVLPFKHEKLKSSDIQSILNVDLEEEAQEFCAKLKRGKDIIVRDLEKTLSRKNLLGYKAVKTLKESNVKSDYGLLVRCENKIVGVLIIHFINEKRVLNHDELNFLKIIREHAGMALCQAELYKKIKLQAERENLLRKITETIRSSLDFNKTKHTIVEIIGKTLGVDRCFITEYNKTSDKFLLVDEEYLSSNEFASYKGVDLNETLPNFVEEFKKGKLIIMDETGLQLGDEKIDLNDSKFTAEKEAGIKFNINSGLNFPLFYGEEFLGNLVLHSTKVQHKIGEEEVNFLNLISSQIALALHQAKLYEKIQLQAERERISRNIIEILRSTLDKTIIKHLFVKNIGKYFNADRVYFSEFDTNANKYLPVEEKAEYLSNPNEKSFVGYDVSGSTMRGHIQPLIEKRELIIPNWKGYIEKNPKEPEFISLYKDANVRSSYGFPVMYEGTIMGYFCIEFTHKISELLNEDINRIRNICTQAGIALYHAGLYMQVQEALQSKREFITRVRNGIKEPVDNIIRISKALSELKCEQDKQQEYLNNIVGSCNKLMELTKDISDG